MPPNTDTNRYILPLAVPVPMPEHCPHCSTPVDSIRKEPDDGRPYEVWRCEQCDEEWRHPDETVLNKDLDFSKRGNQLSRRDADTDLNW